MLAAITLHRTYLSSTRRKAPRTARRHTWRSPRSRTSPLHPLVDVRRLVFDVVGVVDVVAVRADVFGGFFGGFASVPILKFLSIGLLVALLERLPFTLRRLRLVLLFEVGRDRRLLFGRHVAVVEVEGAEPEARHQ